MQAEEQPLIWNPILRQHQILAPHRMQRREGTSDCPFCADLKSGLVSPTIQAWLHVNDFPPLIAPWGEAYVVIYHRDHERTFADLTTEEALIVCTLWRDLYLDLSQRYPAVMIFENHGEAIGQTQRHPHGQAYGLSFVPPVLAREQETIEQASICPFCQVCEELNASAYEIASNDSWHIFLPPFARYPYETHIYPRRHFPDLAAMNPKELADLAALLPGLIRGYNGLQNGALAPMPYLLGLHQIADSRFHFHLEILAIGRAAGKLKYAASSEALWGVWTNDSSPLLKAEELRLAVAQARE